MHKTIHPEGWPPAPGYANGMLTNDGHLFVSGQLGCLPDLTFEAGDFVGQARQALVNVRDIVEGAGGCIADIVRLTWYVTDRAAYLAAQEELAPAYQDVMGRHFPAMTLVVVAGLVAEEAMVEIEATALLRS